MYDTGTDVMASINEREVGAERAAHPLAERQRSGLCTDSCSYSGTSTGHVAGTGYGGRTEGHVDKGWNNHRTPAPRFASPGRLLLPLISAAQPRRLRPSLSRFVTYPCPRYANATCGSRANRGRFGQLTVRGLPPLKIRSLVGCSPTVCRSAAALFSGRLQRRVGRARPARLRWLAQADDLLRAKTLQRPWLFGRRSLQRNQSHLAVEDRNTALRRHRIRSPNHAVLVR